MTRPDVRLRDTQPDDLPRFFAHQRDPEGVAMAGVPSREREAFDAHWEKVLADPGIVLRTILADGEVAGHVTSWAVGGERFVGYWLARAHWGRGVASLALSRYLEEMRERPLVALTARTNAASVRVLEKAGFVERAPPDPDTRRFELP